MLIRGKVKNFFHNSRYAKKIGYKLPDRTYIRTGVWDFDNYTKYQNDDIVISVGVDYPIGFYKISITIDHTKVYDDRGWVHNIPKNMKEYIFNHIRILEGFNISCRKDKVYKSYNQKIKQLKHEEKQEKIRRFEDEKRKLINKFR